ncbi:MAG: DsbC family protein [Thermodesulfovibrionales bacterium]
MISIRNIVITLGMLTLVLFGSRAYGFGGCEVDCQKCHSLEKNEVEQILSKMKRSGSKVVDIKMSPVRGLWEVSLVDNGARDTLYVGFSKKQIVRGMILDLDAEGKGAGKAPELRPAALQQKAPVQYIDTAKIPLDTALVLGDKNAEHKVVIFTDPDCPYCARLHDELRKVIAEKNDIVFYLKLMPLQMHPDAHWKSRSIMCSRSLQLLEDNFSKKQIPRPACETGVVDDTVRLGAELGITGTPTMIMPDGFVVFGGRSAKGIRELVMNHVRRSL